MGQRPAQLSGPSCGERARGEAARAGALRENRRAVLEAFGAGLQLGLFYFPPVLRRQVYGALGLAVVVFPDGPAEIEGHFDAEAIRLTKEVEEHALALREAEGKANTTPARGAAEGWERLERELIRVRNEQTLTSSFGTFVRPSVPRAFDREQDGTIVYASHETP